jgi:hypothetical protein
LSPLVAHRQKLPRSTKLKRFALKLPEPQKGAIVSRAGAFEAGFHG